MLLVILIAKPEAAGISLTGDGFPHFLTKLTPNAQNHVFAKKSNLGMWGISFSPSSDGILGPFLEFGTHIPNSFFYI